MQTIAPEVHWLALGNGWRGTNVYLIGTPDAWCLVDAGWEHDAPAIRRAARDAFGAHSHPVAILLTHCHPDHAGAARELALDWRCDVWLHPNDLPLAGTDLRGISACAGPLDRWAILPALRLMGPRRRQAVLDKGAMTDVVRTLEPGGSVPGLPDWRYLVTPGHTPGHVAFLREDDGMALTGDALTTVDLNSLRAMLTERPTLANPPWYTTWDWALAKASAASVARLAPRVIAAGHGKPLGGADAEACLHAFSHPRSPA